jgi:arylformamidase
MGDLSVALVYRDFDQQALDFQYNNQAQVADPMRYIDWYRTASETARARVAHISDIAYGSLPDERLDIFQPTGVSKSDRRPVVVFLHGGAWRNLDLASSSFPAETFTARGALYVSVGFSCMPAAQSLDEIVAQVRTALAWLWLNIESYGGDRTRLHLTGHSSGAHLAAAALGTDWPRLHGIPPGPVRSAVLISGIYDLEPVRLSYRNETLKLDRAAEIRNSPCRNLPVSGPPVLIGCGEFDTAEFKRQAHDFEVVWQRCYGNAGRIELAGLNHYETIETLVDPKSPLSCATYKLFEI